MRNKRATDGTFAKVLDVDLAKQMFTSGQTLTSIARQLGVSVSAVSYAFKRIGLVVSKPKVIRQPKQPRPQKQSKPRPTADEMRQNHLRAIHSEEYVATKRKRESSVEWAESQSKIQKDTWSDKDLLARHSLAMKTKWADEQYASAVLTDIRSRPDSAEWRRSIANSLRVRAATEYNVAVTSLVNEWGQNNAQRPDEVSTGSGYVADWVCSVGHMWTCAVKDRFRSDRPSGCPSCAGQVSGDELVLQQFIEQFGFTVERNVRGLLANNKLELDLYIPELKIGIEVCGQYWHSELMVGATSHYDKWAAASAVGIRLVTIFDSELYNRTEAVEGYLLAILNIKPRTVYARNCTVIQIDQATAKAFVDAHHIQGAAHSSVSFGLYCNTELLAVMSFSRKDNDVADLSRFCVKTGVNVPGGASKLLTAFLRWNKTYTKLVSFSDNRWSAGRLYKQLGFTMTHEVSPSYWYYKRGKRELKHKFGFRLDAIKSKLGQVMDGETESQAMARFGYDRIWDCGKLAWSMVIGSR